MSGLVNKEDKIIVFGQLAQYQYHNIYHHHHHHQHHHHHHYQKACSLGVQGFFTFFCLVLYMYARPLLGTVGIWVTHGS